MGERRIIEQADWHSCSHLMAILIPPNPAPKLLQLSQRHMFTDYAKFGWIIGNIIAHGHDMKAMYAAIALGLVIAILYFRIFFKDLSDFKDAWFDFGRGLPSRQFSPRVSFWLIISVGSGFLAYYQLPGWFPHLFGPAK